MSGVVIVVAVSGVVIGKVVGVSEGVDADLVVFENA